VGDGVTRGQVLGLLGNTGNSDAPHLHFHVMDGPLPLGSNGLPYVFRTFESEGAVVTSPEDLLAGQPVVVTPTLAGRHQLQLPLDSQLVSFPPVAGGGR
jgi:murein DD-endopeptidase MepM/ murein hydrolase activator NlpD